MITYADGFGGFGGATVGAIQAGLTPTWTIEIDPRIAEINKGNLAHTVIVEDLLNVNPKRLDAPHVMHWSPPCTRASIANGSAEINAEGTKESALDIALANKIIEFSEIHTPNVITIENVWGYRRFQSWRGGRKCEGILNALHRLGYWVQAEHVNAADLGVPQTRQRMIVRAVRGGWVPYLPQAGRWVGWYEAIEDLIPTLPESRFAPWQIKRLPENISTTLWTTGRSYDQHGNEKYGAVTREQNEPSVTVRASSGPDRAFIVDNQNGSRPPTYKMAHEPIMTVLCYDPKHPAPKAWLQHGRVVAMTPRALARFQSFPDSYRLPDNRTLAAKGIGNACPPLMMRRIYEGLTQ